MLDDPQLLFDTLLNISNILFANAGSYSVSRYSSISVRRITYHSFIPIHSANMYTRYILWYMQSCVSTNPTITVQCSSMIDE